MESKPNLRQYRLELLVARKECTRDGIENYSVSLDY